MKHLVKTLLCGLLAAGPASVVVAGERHYFNDLPAPESIEDLLNIETALKSTLPATRAATVCLELGEEKGSGSGVIVSPDGLILTAAHVSGGVGRTFEAVLEDGTRLPVKSLGLISDTDAAMAQIQGEGPFPFIDYDKENSTRLGDWVMSLGHSGGFDQDRGVVVRLGRVVRMAQHTWQTDGTLIGGDSGGPLFNLHGQLIGIHSRVGKNKGENMHVPISEFLDKWEIMLAGEFVGEGPFASREPGFLGLQLEEKEGALLVQEAIKGTAAETAGFLPGDVLLRVGADEVGSIKDLRGLLKDKFEGDKVEITYRRENEEKTVEVELLAR